MPFGTSIILLLLNISLFLSKSESQPGFTKEPTSPSYVVEGNGLTLQWKYTLGGSLRIAKLDLIKTTEVKDITERSASEAEAFIYPDYQGRVEANITATQTNVTFLSLTRADTGNYAFAVTREPDRKKNSSSVTITVQYPPEINSTSVSSDVVVEGDPSVTLACTADGEPTPNVTWTRVYANGSDSGVLATGNQFVLENNRNNSGTYRCTAYNRIGIAPNRTVKVDVNFKPENVKLLVNDSIICEGDAISITCSANGKPAVHTYQLYENGIPVVDGNSSAGVWIRKDLKGGDLSYSCVANNTVGTAEKTVSVTVKESQPVFTKEPTSPSYVVEGNRLFLHWNYALGGTFRIAKLDLIRTTAIEDITERSASEADAYIYPDYQGRVEVSITATQTNITFLSMTRADTGQYAFQITREPDRRRISSLLTITVQYPPEFVFVSGDAVLDEGEGGPSVTLSCIAEGVPTPTITWTRVYDNGSDSGILETGNQFVLHNNRTNGGTYHCTAYNGIGTAPNRTVKVEVNFRPKIVKPLVNDSNVCEGDVISITCSADNRLAVHTYQLFQNEILVVDGNSSAGVWILRSVLKEGNFSYRCVANNIVGTTEEIVNITVKVPSKVYPLENMTVIEGENRTLTCSVSGGMLTVTWTEVSTGSQSNGIMRDLTNISRNDAGEYKCEAINDCGNSSASTFLTVHFKPEKVLLTTSAMKKTACLGDVINFTCSANANPAVTSYQLFKNDSSILDTSKPGMWSETLEIAGVFFYRCVANNTLGSTHSTNVMLTVNGSPCLEECTNGRNCREFGKYLCLCPKGKTGQNCKENDTMAVVIMISLKINNKTWREELTDLSDLHTQGFVGVIVDSVDEEFKGSGVREINVTRLREGSVIADISLTFGEPVGESEVESFLQDAINDGGLGTLKVDTFVVGPTLPDLVTVPGPVPSEPTKVNKDVIYGSVIGVLGLILAVIAVFTAWKHRQRERDDRLNAGTRKSRTLKNNEGFELESINGNLNTVTHHGPGHYMDLNEVRSRNGPATDPTRSYLEINEYAPLHPGTRSWEVERENVTIEKVIGKGAFGQVAQGKASNLRGREETITVAIKMLKGNARDLERKDLLSELEIMKKLKPHPHVIKLLGCITKSDPLLVLIEYVPYGDLRGYLRKSRHLEDNYFNDPDIKPQTSLASQQLMKFSWQVADGMHYLSSKNIIHRDLAARNVLVGERERCKVTDFGMARDVCQQNIYERKSKGRLPVKWTASEALLYGRYTTKSDVWSFGIVLYEIFTIGGSPYPKIDGRKIAHLLSQGYRMPRPRHVDDTLYKIMQDCWQENPDDRPVFESLRNDLKEMENQHQRLINMQLYDNILYASVE